MTDIHGLDDLMVELGAVANDSRTPMDRYREFRQVFLGTEEGKRVLRDILGWGHAWRPVEVMDPTNLNAAYHTFRNCGERNLALKILTAIEVEPGIRPTQQTRQPKE